MSHPHESFPWVMSHSCSNMTTTMLYLYHTWLSPTNYKKIVNLFFIFLEKIRLLIGRPIRLIIPSRSTKRANRVAARKKKRNKMENRIFWVDCEMTGLDYMGKGNWIFQNIQARRYNSEKPLRTFAVTCLVGPPFDMAIMWTHWENGWATSEGVFIIVPTCDEMWGLFNIYFR